MILGAFSRGGAGVEQETRRSFENRSLKRSAAEASLRLSRSLHVLDSTFTGQDSLD